MKFLPVLIFLLISLSSHSQTCEQYERKLFHMLPEYVPADINCTDSRGRKQGWWINYKVIHNPGRIPDVQDIGNYVDHYSYGRFQDDRKIGRWERVENVHQIWVSKVDSFRYSGDTITVFSEFVVGPIRLKIEYIKDSSIINSIAIGKKDTVYVNCSKPQGCAVTYQGNIVNRFPHADFEANYLMSLEQIEYSKDNWQHKANKNSIKNK